MPKLLSPRSQRAWDYFQQQVAALGAEVLEPEWLGSDTPHRCRCAKGHECSPRPASVQQGRGICKTCAGSDSEAAWKNFCTRVTELNSTVLEKHWLGSQTPHRCRCANGHECKPRPSDVQRGGGICGACVGFNGAAWANFRKSVAEKHGGTVLESNWLGSHVPHRCLCVKGHECSPRPAGVQKGQGICKTCVGQDPVAAWGNFQQRVMTLDAEVLESEWLGALTPHRCRCVNGHECWPLPASVQQGRGICKTCVGRDPVAAWENFRRQITEQGGTILETEWLGSDTPHRCRCAKGHKCRPTPSNIKRGHGMCPVCAGKEWDVLYVTRNPVTSWVKFGITSQDGRARLGTHRVSGYIEVIRLEAGLSEGLALHIEQKIKLALAMVDAKPVRGREYFSDEYLALIMNEIDNWLIKS